MSASTQTPVLGIRIFPHGPNKAGALQDILVEIDPGGAIPLNIHTVDTEIFIVAGNGWVCSADELNRKSLSTGNRVLFQPGDPQQLLLAGNEGLSFISINGYLVSSVSEQWEFELT